MTGDDEAVSIHAIELCRELNRSAAAKYGDQGISTEDVTIAAIYSAFDLASDFTGSRSAALDWLRKALEAIEAQVEQEETLQ